MNCFNLKIISLNKLIFNGSARHCLISAKSGSMGFEARHEPFVSVLEDNSKIVFQPESGNSESIEVQNGLIAFKNNNCLITVYNPKLS